MRGVFLPRRQPRQLGSSLPVGTPRAGIGPHRNQVRFRGFNHLCFSLSRRRIPWRSLGVWVALSLVNTPLARGHPSPSWVAMGLRGALGWGLLEGTLLGASVDVSPDPVATCGAGQSKVGVKGAKGASQECVWRELPATAFLGSQSLMIALDLGSRTPSSMASLCSWQKCGSGNGG